jgi:membrane protease YdiL (CAAX protease family)
MNTPEPIPLHQPVTEPNRLKQALRGVGPVGIAVAVGIIMTGFMYGTRVCAPLVLLWVLFTRTPWRDLGFARPRSWPLAIVGGIVAGIVCKLIMQAVVMPLLGAPDVTPNYHSLVHNRAALPGLILYMIFVAGLGEELIFRGFMFERLGRLLGSSRNARIAIVLITATIFGLGHYPEHGWTGVAQAFIMAVMVGAYFAITRNIWPVIILHATFDVLMVFIIYFGLEARIANVFF